MVDTPFHRSRTKLQKWYYAMFLFTTTRNGVAAKEIQRQLGVTYKCAWRMCHELRKLMASADYQGPLGGHGKHVEIDETLVGGKSQARGFGSRLYKKTMVMGLVERGGRLRAAPVPDDRVDTLEPIVVAHVLPGTTVSTDGLPSYKALGDTFDHGVVRHHLKEYVRGKHHTNSIEGHWSLFKRAVRGTHVHISSKHAWKYQRV
jgi:hypothetical protein